MLLTNSISQSHLFHLLEEISRNFCHLIFSFGFKFFKLFLFYLFIFFLFFLFLVDFLLLSVNLFLLSNFLINLSNLNPMSFPRVDLLYTVDTNSLFVVLEYEEFFMFYCGLSRILGILHTQIRLSFAIRISIWKFTLVHATCCILFSKPERDKSNYDLVNFPNWVP